MTQDIVTLHFISTLLSIIQVSVIHLHVSSNTVCFTQFIKQFHKCLRQSAVIHFVTEYWAFIVSASRKVIWCLAVFFKSFLEIQHVFGSFDFNNLNTLKVYWFHCWITRFIFWCIVVVMLVIHKIIMSYCITFRWI